MSAMQAYFTLQEGKRAVYEVVPKIAELGSQELYAKLDTKNVLFHSIGVGFSGAHLEARNGVFF